MIGTMRGPVFLQTGSQRKDSWDYKTFKNSCTFCKEMPHFNTLLVENNCLVGLRARQIQVILESYVVCRTRESAIHFWH